MSLALREIFGRTLQELKDDDRIVVLDADLGKATKADSFAKVCPERYIDVGIAEQDMVGMAAGLAAGGMIPIATSFSVFVTGRAFDQIRNTVCYANLNVKLVGTHSGVTVGYDGGTHQAIEDLAIMRSLPNMTVLCPSDEVETRAAIFAAIEHKGPVYLRISRVATGTVHDKEYTFKIGKGEILKQGNDVAIIATGIMVVKAIEAGKQLAADGIEAMVVNMPSIKPIDKELLIEVAKRTGKIVTAEEHTVIGGLGSAVSEALSEYQPTQMRYVGVKDKFGCSGSPEDLLTNYHLQEIDIIHAVKDIIK
ncbi:transketolase family protein [Anaerosinus sp.]|uniref:transketolase family protein n=1 Tax=Selenobaculum sp. TaxID=3074374 RepID=UPI003AB620C2